jgi:multiple antibiotic resistance protein
MVDVLAAFVRVVAFTVAALLPIINPVGGAPIFLTTTPGASNATRRAMARRIAIDSLILLVAAMLVGSYVLLFFGLSLPVVKIAGGLLVLSTGWQLLRAEASPDSRLAAAPAVSPVDDERIRRHSFYPLTFPLTVGPGSLSVALTLGATTRVQGATPLTSVLGTALGLVIVVVTIYVCYRFASTLIVKLGDTGTVVLLRLSAFIVLAIGVQILCDGVIEEFHIPVPRGL